MPISLNLTKNIEKLLGADQYGVGALRSIEWGKKYLWDVSFSNNNLPEPFNKFIPAVDIEEDRAILESHTVEAYLSSYKIPQKSGVKGLKITFHDDINNTILNWLSDWINIEILNNGDFISPLSSCVKLCTVKKLQNNKRLNEVNDAKTYAVYPEGTLTYSGSSSSDAQLVSADFVVVGINTKKVEGRDFDFMRDIVNRVGII